MTFQNNANLFELLYYPTHLYTYSTDIKGIRGKAVEMNTVGSAIYSLHYRLCTLLGNNNRFQLWKSLYYYVWTCVLRIQSIGTNDSSSWKYECYDTGIIYTFLDVKFPFKVIF